jgi:hypothetical protein
MADCSLTRYECILGARDPTTGHCSKTWDDTTIRGAIVNQGATASPILSAAGLYARYPSTGYIAMVIEEDDVIKDAFGDYYVVETKPRVNYLDLHDHWMVGLQKVRGDSYFVRPATSGTWHLDSDSLQTDARFRTKNYLDTYVALIASTITENDGATPADFVFMFAKPDYHLWREFIGNELAVVGYIEDADSQPEMAYDESPYKFREQVTIKLCAMDKTTISAVNLLEKMDQAIRSVITTYPLGNTTGNIKEIVSSKSTPEDLGGYVLYSKTITLKYTRSNDDYVPTKPEVTYYAAGTGTFTYILANCVEQQINGESPDQYLRPLGYIGNSAYFAGDNSLEIKLKIDLDMEHTNLTHKRPQTSTPKTDVLPYQVWLDIKHNQATTDEYLLLDLGWGDTLKVRLVSMQPNLSGDENTLTLTFKEYRATSASSESYTTRFGIGT